MSLELNFKSVCAAIKKQGKGDPKLIEGVDALMGLALVCSPVFLGPVALAALPTLAVKNELTKIGKSVFERLTKAKDEDYVLRYETMRAAYGLLVFTAFFDALDASLPDAFRKEIALLQKEKNIWAREVANKTVGGIGDSLECAPLDSPVAVQSFPFPHPAETLAQQTERQTRIWKQMAQGFMEFVKKFAFWDQADEKRRAALVSGLEKLAEESAKRFHAQYFELARRFEDFAVWANLQAQKGTKVLIEELSDYVKHYAALSSASERNIDVGFEKLRQAVLHIPETLRTSQATEIAEGLNKHYRARINDPIIENKEAPDDEKPRLSFPRVCDAFVPQSFRVLRQGGTAKHFEDESTWSELPRRNDLGAFLLSYLSSPYSTEAPLLILGHPGSGKSLLTTVLSAQLMSRHFTAIRVPLREVNADADIVTQIEESIRRITGGGFDSWIKLSALFQNCPPLVILDGYDELLQASGQVFASYIKDAQRFQEREAEQGRPLRIIITSRVTLIDKAAVPAGATIVRLLEFDQIQRERWSQIWNNANASYFREAGLEKFSLPSEKERGSEKILNLAEQPLLLLMLALYDSQDNQLRASKGLDRTKLYESLLRRFVIREREKERAFNDARQREREKVLSMEMQRLGVAALGMYNRRKVHILAPELDDDLAFFKLEREIDAKQGKTLSQADLLLGSFFFIHKSKAQHNSETDDTHEETAAFEFLHNTFGEFLTADFIVRRAIAQVQALRAADASEALRSMMDKMLGTADGFERDWFASLVYTPLFTRPVIMEMIREWTPHVLKEVGLSSENFVSSLDTIILNQIRRMLSKREMPQIMRKETAQEGYRVPFGDHPLVGHIAIYSINLILLRLISGRSPLIFDESEVASHEDGTRPWDRLTYIWRSWFSLGNLNGLTSAMIADRAGPKITVTTSGQFRAAESRNKLQEFQNVALSLGDNVSAGITGLCLFDPSRQSEADLNETERRLRSEGIDLETSIAITRLIAADQNPPRSSREFARYANEALTQVLHAGRTDQLENVCSIIGRAFQEQAYAIPWDNRFTWLRELVDARVGAEIAFRSPSAARILLELATQANDADWVNEFGSRFLDHSIREMPLELLEGNDKALGSWLLLLGNVIRNPAFYRYRHRRETPILSLLDPRRLLAISERNRDAALKLLTVMRGMKGLEGTRGFPGFANHDFERFEMEFESNSWNRLWERYPEVAVVHLRTLRELFGRPIERYVHQITSLGQLPELDQMLQYIDQHPEVAIACLQILREGRDLGSPNAKLVLEDLAPKIHLQAFDIERLIELTANSPERAEAYLAVLREISLSLALGRKEREGIIERMANIRYLDEISQRDLKLTAVYLRLLRQINGGRLPDQLGDLGGQLFRQMFGMRDFLDFGNRRPEPLDAYFQMLRELGGQSYLEQIASDLSPEFYDRLLSKSTVPDSRVQQILDLRTLLLCARTFESRQLSEGIANSIEKGLGGSSRTGNLLSSLPLASLSDLRWLSTRRPTPSLRSWLSKIGAQQVDDMDGEQGIS